MIKNWPIACKHLTCVEPDFKLIIKHLGDQTITPHPFPSLFYALSRSIIYQQLSTKAANAIFERFINLFPDKRSISAKQLLHISDQQLRSAGLSRSKLNYIKGLAQAVSNRQLPGKTSLYKMSDQAIIEQLTQIKGIGVWSVQMLLMFHLLREDVMPSLDLGVRQGFAVLKQLSTPPSPKELEQLTQHWSPYRSVASWYCWRIVEQQRALQNQS